MKKILLLLFVFVGFLPLSAQVKTHEEDVKVVLLKLFEYSKTKNFEAAAKYIAYSGKDENRNGVDRFNITDRFEFNQVKRICMQIYALFELSDYSIGDYKATFEEGVTQYILYVHFTSGEQEIVKEFRFIRSPKNEYLLNGID